jgi:hypothetical protein
MISRRTGNKKRNRKAVNLKLGIKRLPAKAFCLSPCLKAFEDGETREVEWFGELRAQEPQPLSTRRKI